MHRVQYFIVASFVFCVSAATAMAQTKTDDQSSKDAVESVCQLPQIQQELAKRVAKDQAARKRMIKGMQRGEGGNSKIDSTAHNEVAAIDKENKTWLAKLIEEHGWLGKTLVGKKGAYNAWLLVQHADQDLPFQKKCLSLMTEMSKGEVAPVNIAYLTDRVLSAESKPQRYGTQCTIENGKAVVKKVEDPENLNQRRKELGLEPIEDYLKFVESMYVKPSSDASKKTEDDADAKIDE